MRLRRAAFAPLTLLLVTTFAHPSFGQTEAELASARKMFADAVKDEEKHDYEIALAKFRKVQTVRDTASVRFRIGACLEGLHRLRESRAAYAKAAELAVTEPDKQDVAQASRDKVADLDKRIPALTLTLSPNAPADAAVTLDDQPVEKASLGQPIQVDPGDHKVNGHATGAAPFTRQVKLGEGGRDSVTVVLDPGAPNGGTTGGTEPFATPPDTTTPGGSNKKTLGWILVGVGAGLVVVSGVTFLVRENTIGSIEDTCPGRRCPESTRGNVTSDQDLANTLMPVGIIAGVAGVAAAGVGVYFLATSKAPAKDAAPAASPTSPTTPPAAPPPAAPAQPESRGLRLRVASVPGGGGALFLGGRF